MYRVLALVMICCSISVISTAQFSRYVVKLKDKAHNTFSISNPSQYLSQRAIERRQRYNISIDSTDLPVTARYIDSIRNAGTVTILNTSKWLNTVTIKTSDAAAINKINSFPFVMSADPVAPLLSPGISNNKLGTVDSIMLSGSEVNNLTDVYNYGRSNGQVKIHKGDFLHNLGFRGEGMQLAMLDAGFFRYLTLPTFDSIRNNGQILGTWDFVANEASVDEDHNHGMHCLSTIAANMPGVFVGTAPKTSFYLYRTEDVSSEYPVEEYNMAAGFERADSAGADICSVSLGYYHFDNSAFNYSYADMDGNTTASARAADLAAKKGMMMVVAAGNEGTNPWHYLITPSDGDSVLTVGAVDTLGNIGSFSSYGPSGDGDIKPNLASVGFRAIVANTSTGSPIYGNGTSFATPNLAGIVTCLWQAFPEFNNMRILDALQQNAHLKNSPDDRVGYGIPDARDAFIYLQKQLFQSTVLMTDFCKTELNLRVKADSVMDLFVERKLSGETAYSTIQTIEGSGSFSLKNYSISDNLGDAPAGTTWYRFRMEISTDTSFYMDSVAIAHQSCIITSNSIEIGPVPVVNDLNVIISRLSPAKFEIVLHNAAGQRIYRSAGNQAAGRGTHTLPMSGLSRGAYFVTVYINNEKAITKEILK